MSNASNGANDVKITAKGIKKTLNGYNSPKAVAEFVWNGFDANASKISLFIDSRKQGSLEEIDNLIISDNGDGIPFEQLALKFEPFMESQKALTKHKKIRDSKQQGDEGRGQLTFFKFCETAKWETVYSRGGENFGYQIEINSDTLQTYSSSQPVKTEKPTGTTVTFSKLSADMTAEFIRDDVVSFLKSELCWFLELNSPKKYSVEIDKADLGWQSIIADREDFSIEHPESRTKFQIRYVQWREWLPEFSKYYFLDAAGHEKFKENTTFNNKNDKFFHSLYISSDFFSNLTIPENQPTDGQVDFLSAEKEPYFFLKRELGEYLKTKRKRLLRQFSDALIESYEKDGVFPRFKSTSYDAERKKDLVELIKTLYESEPRVFQDLNTPQKKTFVGLLNVLLDSDERNSVLHLIEEIIQLDKQEQDELVALLKTTKLNRVIRTLKLIADRYTVVGSLKNLVFNPNINANEEDDLQAAIEAHYWLFGEEYHLVTAAEPSLEEALRRLIYIEKGYGDKVKIEHKDRLGQMDIFAIREIIYSNREESIVVELKHPQRITLGEKELSQVYKYMGVILSEPRFNGQNRLWKFILVGKQTDDYIKRQIKNCSAHGEDSLVYNVDNCKIYVKTWDEVFTDFECKHNFLNRKLELQRDNLKIEARSNHIL